MYVGERKNLLFRYVVWQQKFKKQWPLSQMSEFCPFLSDGRRWLYFLWSGFFICKCVIDLFLLAIGSFCFVPTAPLDTLCIPRKPIFASYRWCAAFDWTWRGWTTSSDTSALRFFSLMEIPTWKPREIFCGKSLICVLLFRLLHCFMLFLQSVPRNIQRTILLPCVPML